MEQSRLYLMYHAIGTENPDLNNSSADSIYTVSADAFRSHMEFLASRGDGLNEKICITFDDGHISNYEVALPILKEYNLRATFFITTDWIGGENFLTWNHLRLMLAQGMEIGSHTKSHKPLTSLDSNEATEEIAGSKRILEERLSVPIRKISCPGGFYNTKAVGIMEKSGYAEIFTSDVGVVKDDAKNHLLPRVSVKSHYTLEQFRMIVEGKGFFFCRLVAADKIKRGIKSRLPSGLYQILYAMKKGAAPQGEGHGLKRGHFPAGKRITPEISDHDTMA